jgi:hypothetical protein
MRPALALLALTACSDPRATAEDPSAWFDSGVNDDVDETVEYTEQNYDFPAADGATISAFTGAVFPVEDYWDIAYGPGEQFPDGGCPSTEDADLPFEIEGTVTLRPAWYIKTDGCAAQVNDDGGTSGADEESEEKYYSSYFIQDRSAGIFVLYDSRFAPFDTGDRVRLRVRGVRTSFDVNMVYAHDIVEVQHLHAPLYYEVATGAFTNDQIGRVMRIEGTVTQEIGTFGDVDLEADDGTAYTFSVAQDLSRRRAVDPKLGQRIQVTGPVFLSYGEYPILVTQAGQVSLLAD